MKPVRITRPSKDGGGYLPKQLILLKRINAAVAAGRTDVAGALRAQLAALDASNVDRRKKRLPKEPPPLCDRQIRRTESLRRARAERKMEQRLAALIIETEKP